LDVPTTLGGWAGLIFAVVSTAAIILGIIIALAKSHIDNRINKTLAFTVKKAIVDGLIPVNSRLDSMQIQLVTQDGELARIRDLETIIKNGLEGRQRRIENKVDEILHHYVWDGTERRDT
jgi:hypothetical protein